MAEADGIKVVKGNLEGARGTRRGRELDDVFWDDNDGYGDGDILLADRHQEDVAVDELMGLGEEPPVAKRKTREGSTGIIRRSVGEGCPSNGPEQCTAEYPTRLLRSKSRAGLSEARSASPRSNTESARRGARSGKRQLSTGRRGAKTATPTGPGIGEADQVRTAAENDTLDNTNTDHEKGGKEESEARPQRNTE